MPDRSFRAFLSAVRTEPGGPWRVAAALTFGLALGIEKGWAVAFLTLIGSIVLGCAVGYPYFRRRGRLLGGIRRPSA